MYFLLMESKQCVTFITHLKQRPGGSAPRVCQGREALPLLSGGPPTPRQCAEGLLHTGSHFQIRPARNQTTNGT